MKKQRKAVALISGGLDSMLAAKTIMDQGIHVEGINFFTGFCVEGHTHAIREKNKVRPNRNNALWVAEQLGIKLHIVDVIEEYKKVVINPKHGYGAHMNPCLDCKIFMVNKAKQWIVENDFDFIIIGGFAAAVYGYKCKIISIEDLIKATLALKRPKDLEVARELELIQQRRES